MDRTLVILKPDCICRGLAGEIISIFEKKGLKIVGMKMIKLNDAILDEFYAHHKGKKFFEDLKAFMSSTPVIAIVLEGKNVVNVVRKMCGVTIGREAEPGTIRGNYSMSLRNNIVHASDSEKNAEREIAFFFKDSEIYEYNTGLPIYCEEELEEEEKKEIKGKPRKLPEKED
jgi:nucleoside-diphosphate kinase